LLFQKLESDLSNSSARISELETIVEQSVPRQQADQERRLLEQKVKVKHSVWEFCIVL